VSRGSVAPTQADRARADFALQRFANMLLDIAKLILQKDTRESFKELVDLVKRKPEWKADLVELDGKFSYAEQGEAETFVRYVHEVLLRKTWPEKRAGVAEFVIRELMDNAFIHGQPPSGSSGVVRVQASMTSAWLCCRVSDRGAGFDLAVTLSKQAKEEARGLSRINSLATRLVQDGPNTVEVTVRAAPSAVDVEQADVVHIMRVVGRLDERARQQFEDGVAAIGTGGKVLLDLTECEYISSVGLRQIMVLQKQNRAVGRQAILVVKPESVIAEILAISRFNHVIETVHTREEGLARLSV